MRRHTEQALWDVLEALAVMLVAAVGLPAVSTALGVVVGVLAGGVGVVPGAAVGFDVGMTLLEWLGLSLLLVWVGSGLQRVGGVFGNFLDTGRTARCGQTLIDTGACEKHVVTTQGVNGFVCFFTAPRVLRINSQKICVSL